MLLPCASTQTNISIHLSVCLIQIFAMECVFEKWAKQTKPKKDPKRMNQTSDRTRDNNSVAERNKHKEIIQYLNILCMIVDGG